MSPQHKPGLAQSGFPACSGADLGRFREQPVPLFLPRQPGKLCVERMFRAEKGLSAVQDRRVRRRSIIVAVQLTRAEVESEAARQGRMRVRIEIGIDQVRNLS